MYRGQKAFAFTTRLVSVLNGRLDPADHLVVRRKGPFLAIRRSSDPPVSAALEGLRSVIAERVPNTSATAAEIRAIPRYGIGPLLPRPFKKSVVAAADEVLEMFSLALSPVDDTDWWPAPGAVPASSVESGSLRLAYRLGDGSRWEIGSLSLDTLTD